MEPLERGSLVARRDQIQANLAAARAKAKELEIAIRHAEGALFLLNDLLAESEPALEPDPA